MRSNRKPEPRLHATRITLHRCVDEPWDPGELDNLIELLRDLPARHAHDRTLQKNILAPGEIRMKAGRNLDQRSNPPNCRTTTVRGPHDLREQLEDRRLASTVGPNDAQRLPGIDSKADILQRPELAAPQSVLVAPPSYRSRSQRRYEVTQTSVDFAVTKLLPHARELDPARGHFDHTYSAKTNSAR